MPQELHVLQCEECSMYQVHIVKKVPKWNCKVCNFKHSVRKVYFSGSGKEYRTVVQKLNVESANALERAKIKFSDDESVDGVTPTSDEVASTSKWDIFTEKEIQLESETETPEMYTGYTFETPKKRAVESSYLEDRDEDIVPDSDKSCIEDNVTNSNEFKERQEENYESKKPRKEHPINIEKPESSRLLIFDTSDDENVISSPDGEQEGNLNNGYVQEDHESKEHSKSKWFIFDTSQEDSTIKVDTDTKCDSYCERSDGTMENVDGDERTNIANRIEQKGSSATIGKSNKSLVFSSRCEENRTNMFGYYDNIDDLDFALE